MKGGLCKMRERKPKEDVITNSTSYPAAEDSFVGPSHDQSTSLQITPKRGKRRSGRVQKLSLTSTPVHGSCTDDVSNISHSSPQINDAQQNTKRTTNRKTSKASSPCSSSTSQSGKRQHCSTKPRRVSQKVLKQQTEVDGSTPKRRRGRPRKAETEKLNRETAVQAIKSSRPRFELQKPDSSEQEDESLMSSDLSIELSHHEEQLPRLSFQEDEKSDDEEEEELPSFLMQDKKPSSVTEGAFVWCKFRNYPHWPAWVKSVNRKHKKASIIFVDQAFIDTHRNKGFALALKSMKPFDCEEADELMRKAKESYDAAVTWSLELIEDYRIRIACGSFSGSFLEYFNHDMSYPVRRKYPQAESERLTIASDAIIDMCDDHSEYHMEKEEDVCTSTKRLLPDRTHAAHNRANEKLVHFIVKQRMVEPHLLAVIHGQQQSRWLHSFLRAKRRRVVDTYLEDDQQLDQVYLYLSKLYATTVTKSPCLAEVKRIEHVPFVLDVLLPEAIICAIAGVDNVSVKKAEEKYLKGRCISNREKQEFDLMIERQMRRKRCQNTALKLHSDSIS